MDKQAQRAGEYKHFVINELPKPKGRKTPVYSIVSKSGNNELGQIRWYGPWRQYCFYPNEKTIWSTGCQEGIIDFIKQLKAAKVELANKEFGWT